VSATAIPALASRSTVALRAVTSTPGLGAATKNPISDLSANLAYFAPTALGDRQTAHSFTSTAI